MAVLERVYTIPLRKYVQKAPKYRGAKRAVAAVRKFLQRHMKSENVKLGKFLNLELWKHGIRNPPPRIRITAVKDEQGIVKAELYGAPVEKKVEEKKEEAKTTETKLEETKTTEQPKTETTTEAEKTTTNGQNVPPASDTPASREIIETKNETKEKESRKTAKAKTAEK